MPKRPGLRMHAEVITAVPIGGRALSGEDFFKAGGAGAVLARRLAKESVMSGAAAECTATLAIFPGDSAFWIPSLRHAAGTKGLSGRTGLNDDGRVQQLLAAAERGWYR